MTGKQIKNGNNAQHNVHSLFKTMHRSTAFKTPYVATVCSYLSGKKCDKSQTETKTQSHLHAL